VAKISNFKQYNTVLGRVGILPRIRVLHLNIEAYKNSNIPSLKKM
jgi:hypothetical protein